MTGNLTIAPYGSEGGEIQLRHGTDAENGINLDTTGNYFRIFGSPNVGSVFLYNPQTAQLSVGSQHIVRSVNGVGAGTDGNVTLSIPTTPNAYVTATYHSGSSWYRKWSDGFIEQGGVKTGSAGFLKNGEAITLHTSMTSTVYLVFTQNLNTISDENHWHYGTVYNRSKTNFYINNDARDTTAMAWYVCGY